MTIQDWIIAIIVLLCSIEIGRRIIRLVRSIKNHDNPCANCIGGCDLKRMLDEKQQKCRENEQKKGKKPHH